MNDSSNTNLATEPAVDNIYASMRVSSSNPEPKRSLQESMPKDVQETILKENPSQASSSSPLLEDADHPTLEPLSEEREHQKARDLATMQGKTPSADLCEDPETHSSRVIERLAFAKERASRGDKSMIPWIKALNQLLLCQTLFTVRKGGYKRTCPMRNTMYPGHPTVPGPNDIRGPGEVRVVPEDCLAAVQRLVQQERLETGLLVLGNAKNRGGGFRHGAGAQEESIYFRSDFLLCVERDPAVVGAKRQGGPADSEIPIGGVLLSETVVGFRGADWKPVAEPFEFVGLTAVARDKPRLVDGKLESAYLHEMQKTIANVLCVAHSCGAEAVVLGALGCGAFANPSQDVAAAMHSVVDQFRHFFKVIEISVIEDHNSGGINLSTFREAFERPFLCETPIQGLWHPPACAGSEACDSAYRHRELYQHAGQGYAPLEYVRVPEHKVAEAALSAAPIEAGQERKVFEWQKDRDTWEPYADDVQAKLQSVTHESDKVYLFEGFYLVPADNRTVIERQEVLGGVTHQVRELKFYQRHSVRTKAQRLVTCKIYTRV